MRVGNTVERLPRMAGGVLHAITGRWRALAVAGLAHILHDGYAAMIYLLLPPWQAELGLSLAQVGILKTLFSGAMALGQVPVGRLGERWGERMLLFAGTLLTSGAVLALHWAATPVALALLLILGGLGASAQHPLASTVVARAYGGPARRTMLGAYNFAGDLGKMAIPALLTVLIAGFGWRIGTQALGTLGLITAVVLLIALTPATAMRMPTEDKATACATPPLPESVRRRGFVALSAVGLLDSATRAGFLTFLPFVLAHKGATSAATGVALTLIFVGGAAGKFACGALATRIGLVRTIAATELATAGGIVLPLFLPLPFSFVLMPVLGVALNGTSSVLYGTVPNLAPRERQTRSFGLFYTVVLGADAIAPALYGFAGEVISLAGSIVLIAAINLFILPLLLVLGPVLKEEKSAAEFGVVEPGAGGERRS